MVRSGRVGLIVVATDFPAAIRDLRQTMASVSEVTDPDRLRAQIG